MQICELKDHLSKRYLHHYSNSKSSLAIRTSSLGFKFSFLTSLLDCWAYLWNQNCYELRRDLVRSQYCNTIDAKLGHDNKRPEFIHVAIWPLVFHMFADDVSQKLYIPLNECRFYLTVYGVLMPLLSQTFLKAHFQWCSC